MKTYIGIDPSLCGNAVIIIDEQGCIIKDHLVKTDRDCYLNPEQRALDIFEQLSYIKDIEGLERVYIEGLSYSTKSVTLFERCGLLYLLTTSFLQNDVTYSVIPPPALKKWHTTYGFADKEFMMKVAKCKWGIEFSDDNICDAYCLAMMSLDDANNNIIRD